MSKKTPWWQSQSRFYRLWSGVGFLTAMGDGLAAGLLWIPEGLGVLSKNNVLHHWRVDNEVKSLKAALNEYYESLPTHLSDELVLNILVWDRSAPPPLNTLTPFNDEEKPTTAELTQRLQEYSRLALQGLLQSQENEAINYALPPYSTFYLSLMGQKEIRRLDFQALSFSRETRPKFHVFLRHLLSCNPHITSLFLSTEEHAEIQNDVPHIFEQLAYNQRYAAINSVSLQERQHFSFSKEAIQAWKEQEIELNINASRTFLTCLEKQVVGDTANKEAVLNKLHNDMKNTASSPQEKLMAYEAAYFYHNIGVMRVDLSNTLQQLMRWLAPNSALTLEVSSALVQVPAKAPGFFTRLLNQCFASSSSQEMTAFGHNTSFGMASRTMLRTRSSRLPKTDGEIEAYLATLPVRLAVRKIESPEHYLAQCQAEVQRILELEEQYKNNKINIETRDFMILYGGLVKPQFDFESKKASRRLWTEKKLYCHPDKVSQRPELWEIFGKVTAILNGMQTWVEDNNSKKYRAINKIGDLAVNAECWQGILTAGRDLQEAKSNLQEVRSNIQEIKRDAQEIKRDAQEVKRDAQEVRSNIQTIHATLSRMNATGQEDDVKLNRLSKAVKRKKRQERLLAEKTASNQDITGMVNIDNHSIYSNDSDENNCSSQSSQGSGYERDKSLTSSSDEERHSVSSKALVNNMAYLSTLGDRKSELITGDSGLEISSSSSMKER